MHQSEAVGDLICAVLRTYKSDYLNEEDATSVLAPLFDIMGRALFEESREGGEQM